MTQVEKVDPTPEDIQRLLAEAGGQSFVMLNLLRYAKDGGRETYAQYAAAAQPFLEASGGKLLYAGDTGLGLVTPASHDWDTVLLVRYPSPQAFLEMISNPDYLKVTEIRTRALDAAVLQVTTPWPESP
jgi:uncharacterized protein (DUF1330 family)